MRNNTQERNRNNQKTSRRHTEKFNTRQAFLSTAGAPSSRQCRQITRAAHRLPNLKTVILAQDHDEAGERQAETLREKVHLPTHVAFHRHRPPENTDWNDIVNTDRAVQECAR